MSNTYYRIDKLVDIEIRDNVIHVEAKWHGYSKDQNTWEPIFNLEPESGIQSLKELLKKQQNYPSKKSLIQKATQILIKKQKEDSKQERQINPKLNILIEEKEIFVLLNEVNLESDEEETLVNKIPLEKYFFDSKFLCCFESIQNSILKQDDLYQELLDQVFKLNQQQKSK